MLGREKPTNQANTVEVVGFWRGKSINKKKIVGKKTYEKARI